MRGVHGGAWAAAKCRFVGAGGPTSQPRAPGSGRCEEASLGTLVAYLEGSLSDKRAKPSLCPSPPLLKKHVTENPARAEDRARVASSGRPELIYAVVAAAAIGPLLG